MTKTYKIAVIPGDGTGPEVVQEGIKVLNAVATKCGFNLEFIKCSLGGDHYLTTAEILPGNQVEILANSFTVVLITSIPLASLAFSSMYASIYLSPNISCARQMEAVVFPVPGGPANKQ